MDECKFEYYVLNEPMHGSRENRKIESYNVFNNFWVNKRTNEEVRKYLRSPSKFKHTRFMTNEITYGFEAFVRELQSIIMCEEWARCEYEIMVGSAFEDDINKFQKIDCYDQCKPNMAMIAREVIYQYKKYLKEKKDA